MGENSADVTKWLQVNEFSLGNKALIRDLCMRMNEKLKYIPHFRLGINL